MNPRRVGRSEGSILIFTLWIMALLGAVAVGLVARAELSIDAMKQMESQRTGEAYLAALREAAIALVAADTDVELDFPGEPWGAPIQVGETELINGFLSLGRNPEPASLSAIVEDDSAKLNLNLLLAGAAQGGALPLLEYTLGKVVAPAEVQPLANAMIDWWDPDETGPAELDTYLALGVDYGPPNQDLRSIQELRFLSGVTDIIFEGEDANGNGVLDPEEDDGDLLYPPDNADGVLQPGLRDLFTVYGEGEVNINTANAHVLDALLSLCMPVQVREEWVQRFVRQRAGADGVTGTADDQPVGNEAELATLLGEVFSIACVQRGVDLALGSVAFRVHLAVRFPEAHQASYGELVLLREEDRIVVKEWRSWH